VGAPVGPTGCGRDYEDEDEDEDEGAWLVGAGYGIFDADLRFDGEDDYELWQHAVVASFGRRFAGDFSLRLAVGAVLGGELEGQGREYAVLPGWTASLAGAKRWFGRSDEVPFLTTTLAFSMSGARTEERGGSGEVESLLAMDARLGVLFGITLWETWSPYLALRGFGGPVQWRQLGRDRTGSDRHHYAIGAGSSVALGRVELLLDVTVLGERSISVGASASF
jgi:hypothetical protein